jgi:hypothetical protein
VQNDPDDWILESHKMGDIFMNAEVTFSVYCAVDDSADFLHKALSKSPAVQHYVLGTNIGLCRPMDQDRDVTNSGLSR